MVARSFLERHGCVVTLAGNGAEGVKAYEQGRFDLVFMDMQMPVMDGLTATRKIRDFEGWRPRTPIVALTANAMTGQAERCIAAGMDAFLTKPLESARLREVLEKYLQRDEPSTTASHRSSSMATAGGGSGVARSLDDVAATTVAPLRTSTLMDWTRFLAIVDGDKIFACELIEVYINSATQILAELRDGITMGDRALLRRAAHKFKGASANICADAMVTLCEGLELGADHATLAQLAKLVDDVGDRITDTRQAMQRYLDTL
jgi:CheY-like chemotaxis protein/HPt (histidine-containing phosphotransfer) domain-containing protein